MKHKIIVTGGLGFIGSHTVVCLHEAGFEPIIIDNLSNSEASAMDGIEKLIGYKPIWANIDVNDKAALGNVIKEHQPQGVIHFAAFKAVGESVEKPLTYYRNNVGGLITLMEVLKEENIGQFGI
jgi:UDP-glucose 4-epimerase